MCLTLGFPHPDYLLSALTYGQLNDWWNFYRERPFGEVAQDRRYTHQNRLLLSPHLKKDAKVEPEMFQPFGRAKPKPAASESELMDFLKNVSTR